VLRVTVGTDAARLSLLPRARLARMMGAKLRRPFPVCGQDAADARVHYSGDLSAAVRSLTEALLRLLGEPQKPHPRTAKPRSNSPSGAQRATPGVVAPSV
jgi:hypothetical protein